MPKRKTPLVNNQIYHVFNRGINKQPIFNSILDYQRAVTTIEYYRFSKPHPRLSGYLSLSLEKRQEVVKLFKDSAINVEILGWCLMPNHFHFLLKQISDNGISNFVANFQNSYTRYFNVKWKKDGPLLLTQFKAVRIEDDDQLLQVSRYIHLNPYSSFIIKSIDNLLNYPWSSLKEYLSSAHVVKSEEIINLVGSPKKYKKFLLDQADYQRTLDQIKHLTHEGK